MDGTALAFVYNFFSPKVESFHFTYTFLRNFGIVPKYDSFFSTTDMTFVVPLSSFLEVLETMKIH